MKDLDLSRDHDDPMADALPPLALDRQRIVHSAAFRRLLGKTQVFVRQENDHFRTRMTHTLEVSHLARCLAARLGLREELAEVAALAHDIGHAPFGHAGEKALNACNQAGGGFEHNAQSLRIVEELEHPYPQFHGLNLTRAVRACLASHHTRYDRPSEQPHAGHGTAPPEGLCVAVADRVSYALHDLQDGLYAGLLDRAKLANVELWRAAYDGPPVESGGQWHRHLRPAIDHILRRVLTDVADRAPAVRLSETLEQQFGQLDEFLFHSLYSSPQVAQADDEGKRAVTELFAAYVAKPQLMPPRFHNRIPEQGVHRVVTDYIAGMTDRFCLEVHNGLPSSGAGT